MINNGRRRVSPERRERARGDGGASFTSRRQPPARCSCPTAPRGPVSGRLRRPETGPPGTSGHRIADEAATAQPPVDVGIPELGPLLAQPPQAAQVDAGLALSSSSATLVGRQITATSVTDVGVVGSFTRTSPSSSHGTRRPRDRARDTPLPCPQEVKVPTGPSRRRRWAHRRCPALCDCSLSSGFFRRHDFDGGYCRMTTSSSIVSYSCRRLV